MYFVLKKAQQNTDRLVEEMKDLHTKTQQNINQTLKKL